MGGIGFGESSWFNELHRIEPPRPSSRMSPSSANGYSRRALTRRIARCAAEMPTL